MKKLTNDELLERFTKIHQDKYSYDFDSIENGKIKIFCKKHGYFIQRIHDHLYGTGCPKCGIEKVSEIRREKLDNLILRSNEVHNYKYDYSLIKNSKNMNEYITIICPIHGEFRTMFNYHIRGQGCPNCAIDRSRDNLNSFIEKAIKKHGNAYDYSKVNYVNSKNSVEIICKKHGSFFQSPNYHILGQGCPKCRTSKGEKAISDCLTEKNIKFEYQKRFKGCEAKKSLIFDFYLPEENLCIEFDGEQHEISVDYWGGQSGLEKRKRYDVIKERFCLENNIQLFRIRHDDNIQKKLNQINSYFKSSYEIQLEMFIKENYQEGTIIYNDPKEIDIYLPDLKLAFEFNGVYWHNEINKPNNYHLEKTELCEKMGIHLIHIYEDDWVYKQEIIKSRILNLIGKNINKIYARKCEIKEVENSLVREFLITNHLQGFVGSQVKLGLFYNDELVSLMTFGKLRKSMGTKSKENVYEMLRFCNKLNTSVIGGADRLFKYFVNTYKPIEVISYADRSWSQGDLYKKLGFASIGKTQSNYYYVVDGIREYRFNYRKDKLIREGYDTNKTEHQIMLERDIYRIYDSGCLKFLWK